MINEKLKAAREQRGWSIPQIAQYLELKNEQSYRDWESGKLRPSERNLNKLCDLLHTSREELGFEEMDESPIPPRQAEILFLIATGLESKQIAEKLGISDQTVKNHLTAVFKTLHASNRTHAVVVALRNGWIEFPKEHT